ncbi:isopeptide-forming domain-containing fimbrial protein [Streptococcus merionis]|uniref:isopeptide-forming domain-containing fimbrial protein n=1 Tax=Streptococcus merionis TaxID=400065 RepID=UPI0026EA0B14|nr:isopeptide-forming domain-containing fimbrial protein [Streptococcus merionis]
MKEKLRKLWVSLATLFVVLPSATSVLATTVNPTTVSGEPKISREGCKRVIEKTEKVEWKLPRQPIDLVILQDASGSFSNTIGSVKKALVDLTTPTTSEKYDEKNPRLVFTNDAKTTDRVFVSSYQGVNNVKYYSSNRTRDFAKEEARQSYSWQGYKYANSGLLTNQSQVHSFINKISVGGGTPTVPAIDDVLKDYETAKLKGGGMANNRKTVFLLVTDGVANAYRDSSDKKVYIDVSNKRLRSYGYPVNNFYEGAQDYLTRSKELKDAGDRIKKAIGSTGTVVVGFWEDVNSQKKQYESGVYESRGLDPNDSRSVQSIFHEALKTVASPDKEVNGAKTSFYVNEQSDAKRFSDNILKAVTAALVKENVEGRFTVTDGYSVDAVRINGKTVVDKVTDDKTQVLGKVTQDGNKVTISVPESIFNPGDNKFDYDLGRVTTSENVDEDDEQDPADDYKPSKEKIEVPQLTGKFKVGDYESAEIGGKEPTTVEVEEIKYCYPSATKKIADNDAGNDAGQVEDPLALSKKPAYAANLTTAEEGFTYTVNYRFNNSPYEWKENAMLVDPLDYRLEVVSARVEDLSGLGLNYKVEQTTQKDASGNDRTVLYAQIPKAPGAKPEEDKGSYDGLVFKQARLIVEAKFKEEFQKQGTADYTKLLQDSSGYGAANQASIMWNGGETPNEEEHAADSANNKKSSIRRSNAVYVKPPVKTEIKKAVNQKEHEDLKTSDEEFTYTVTSPWPGPVQSFKLEDKVVPELEIIPNSATVTIGKNDYTRQGATAKVEGNTVTVDLNNAETIKTINRLVLRLDKKGEQQDIVLTFKAKIRDGADVSKYMKNGAIRVPNTADVILNGDDPITSNEVTVTPPKPNEPEVTKKINETLDTLTTFENLPYTYNILTTIPNDMASYKKFVITDTLDERLEVAGDVTIKDKAVAEFFTVAVEGQKVTATVKEGKFADVAKLSQVELIIPAKVKAGVTSATIGNKASIDFTNAKGEDKQKETDPVTVTTPDPSKKINKTEDHLDINNESRYTYNIKVSLPTDIVDYKEFVISDELDEKLSVFPGETPSITGAAADFFDVKVDGQKVTTTMKNFAGAKDFAGKEVELVIPAQINKGVTTPLIPNTAKIDFTNKADQSGNKETKPVTVTPPGEEPTVTKKINKSLEHLDTLQEVDYNYNIVTKLPSDITSYKSYVITDTLDKDLVVKGTPMITGNAAKFFDVKVDGQTVTATMKNFAEAKDLAGKDVELIITSQIKAGVTREKIPNTAKIDFTNKSDQSDSKETEPVTVTPPPLTKKINDTLDTLDIDQAKDYNYNIKTLVPGNITSYKSYVIADELDKDLAPQSATITGDAAKFFDVKVEGQTVTATMKDFKAAAELAGKEVELVIVSQIREGVTRQNIPNTAKITYNNNPIVNGEEDPNGEETPPKETPPTPPVTVTPPGEEPTVTKKINKSLEHLDIDNEKDYTYNVVAKLPSDITTYKKFVITDELDQNLAIKGTPSITGAAADFFDIKVEGQTVTATMKNFAEAKDLAGQDVELVIISQIRKDVVVNKIKNTAKIDFTNKSDQSDSKETEPVTVTPRKPGIKLEKSVNDKVYSVGETMTYTLKATNTGNTTLYYVKITDPLEGLSELSYPEGIDPKDITLKPGESVTATATLTVTEELAKKLADDKGKIANTAKTIGIPELPQDPDDPDKPVKPETDDPNDPNNPPVEDEDDEDITPEPPTPTEPTIDKKINRTLEHLDVLRGQNYMYNINVELPNDISTYKEFVVTDTLEDVLQINGTPAVYVDGNHLGEALSLVTNGNTVTVTVNDFAALAGRKQLQLYIPSVIKPDADVTKYTDSKVPNTAKLDFVNSSDVRGEKETKPVTVTPNEPTPPTPPTPRDPEDPVKTVSRVDGKDQLIDKALILSQVSEAFRFDILTKVLDQEYTSLTITDELDDRLKVDYVTIKVEGDALDTVAKELAEAQAKLAEATAKLEALKAEEPSQLPVQLEAAKAAVTELTAKVGALKAELAALQDASQAEAVSAKEAEIVTAEAELVAANEKVTMLEAELSASVTPEEKALAITNATQNVEAAQKVVTELTAKQEELNKALAAFATVDEKGEVTKEALAQLIADNKIKLTVEGQLVTLEITDKAILESLRGRSFRMIIYASIKDPAKLTNESFEKGIDNQATVSFDNKPKVTNTVKVVPPRPIDPPVTPDPEPPTPPVTPDKPTPPAPNTPPSVPTTPKPNKPGKDLPNTGEQASASFVFVGTGLLVALGLGYLGLRKRSK